MMADKRLGLSIGPLLYTPATDGKIADHIIMNKFGDSYSLALCLEDSIPDNLTEDAVINVRRVFERLRKKIKKTNFYLPKIFLRVRTPKMIGRMYRELYEMQDMLFGFVLPKYSPENAKEYNAEMLEVNERAKNKLYMMPILESKNLIPRNHRNKVLYSTKDLIDAVSDITVNIRVGANDLCSYFSLRRPRGNTIYDVLPVADLLTDILTAFSKDYIVAGPVYDFYGEGEEEGLMRELKADRAAGFVGKSVIHPLQIPAVLESLKVFREDYEDAVKILDWHDKISVGSSSGGHRMNELNTHRNWAKQTVELKEIYGLKEDGAD